MMQALIESVCVWTEDREPVRLLWRGRRYSVTDTPTALRSIVAAPELTHPLEPQWGWRFQGTDENGASYVFDVRIGSGHDWELVAVYD